MVKALRLLKNVGKFDNVTAGAALPFEKVTVIYAENARGKTTIASVMRSLSTGEPGHIAERQRLGAQTPPQVVIELAPGSSAVFQQNAWSQNHPNLLVFDDAFVAANVCSGIEVEPSHRQNLLELIIGQQGVALNRNVQTCSARAEQCTREMREKGNAIPADKRGNLSVDDFCALPQVSDLADLIAAATRRLAAAKDAANIAAAAEFSPVHLPGIDLGAVAELLTHSIEDIDASALAQVTSHMKCLGGTGESWVGTGIGFTQGTEEASGDQCPFCAQPLSGSGIFPHYRAYFGESYKALQKSIVDTISKFENAHRADVQTGFERGVRLALGSGPINCLCKSGVE